MEIDIKAESSCKRIVLIEVKKWKNKAGVQAILDFIEKINVFPALKRKVNVAYLFVVIYL